jgi:hypothetical protein
MSKAETKLTRNSVWQIDGSIARLNSDQLRAEVDVSDPESGLKILAVGNAESKSLTLFRVGRPHTTSSRAPNEVDHFTRGNDLIATYSETADSPFRAQIYWRFLPSAMSAKEEDNRYDQSPNRAVGLELILSIQTKLLDSNPTLKVESTLSAVRVSRLADAQSNRVIDVSIAAVPTAIDPETGTGCFLFQLADTPLAYVEMIHPADFHRSTVERGVHGTLSIRLSHQLFAQNLEKGVILRSRIRSLFALAETDAGAIARAYEEFAASEPPLTA